MGGICEPPFMASLKTACIALERTLVHLTVGGHHISQPICNRNEGGDKEPTNLLFKVPVVFGLKVVRPVVYKRGETNAVKFLLPRLSECTT